MRGATGYAPAMTATARSIAAPVADGVWRLTLGTPLKINVFFVREEDGVAVFDVGSKAIGAAIRRAAGHAGGALRRLT